MITNFGAQFQIDYADVNRRIRPIKELVVIDYSLLRSPRVLY